MTEGNIHYVYEHWRPDTGVIFYVGMGKRARAWQLFKSRNRWHGAIVEKLFDLSLSVDVRIIAWDLSAAEACAKEIELIAAWREAGAELVNMTRGGDGLCDPSEDVKSRISASNKARWAAMTPRQRADAIECYKKRPSISAATKEKLRITSTGRVHTADARARISAARKLAGIAPHVRAAQIAAATGRKRAPFKQSTISKMRIAASIREGKKRMAREDVA